MPHNHAFTQNFIKILDKVFSGVMLLSIDGKILDFNKACLYILDKESTDIKGKNFKELVPKELQFSYDLYIMNCERALKMNVRNKFEFPVQTKEGEITVEIECNKRFVSEEDQRTYMLMTLNDITKQKKIQEELETQKKSKQEVLDELKMQQELTEMKTRFVTVASHEFRTPMARVLSSIELIERYLKFDPRLWDNFQHKDKVQTHFSKIKSSINSLTATLNQFLSIGEWEEGKTEYREEDFDLERTILNCIKEVTPNLKEGQHILFDFKSDLKNVCLDQNVMRHILNNLLSNAIKYSPQNKNIHVISFVNDEEIFISIRDEGYGIPKEDQENLFRRFFRAKNATDFTGIGLGLNIVKKYVHLMDGKISFESYENKGTIFDITFPRRKAMLLGKNNDNLKELT
ncbi:PAS domain-containing sensor histidine kinase [Ochrovirga pacifica]|uniref:PAS domain-containing sensor histidine kinase n=1 Tax=Ochrovirga pacifica TaxID=1042376 RepID=UPI0002559D79|nr:PAS domain-containing sensor histidine kinase [Ochrovirga pacifica]